MKVYTIFNNTIGILFTIVYLSVLVIGSLFGYSDDLNIYMRAAIIATLSNIVVYIYYLVRDKFMSKKSLKICAICMVIQLLLPIPFWCIGIIILQ
ncbi:hypothetical protein ABNX05_04165 [Lysinibacillus sp. M3]|uniref:Uncharacterized protein n=1 Tax=Lysinibacillus zambalensis TaxID=3160866 RepID=A0ABV1MMQ5_9BACI